MTKLILRYRVFRPFVFSHLLFIGKLFNTIPFTCRYPIPFYRNCILSGMSLITFYQVLEVTLDFKIVKNPLKFFIISFKLGESAPFLNNLNYGFYVRYFF